MYTKGEWGVDYEQKDVLFVNSPDREICCLVLEEVKENNQEVIANAKLIAAAPKLLEACKLIIRKIEKDDIAMRVVIEKIRNAINKTEGKGE